MDFIEYAQQYPVDELHSTQVQAPGTYMTLHSNALHCIALNCSSLYYTVFPYTVH